MSAEELIAELRRRPDLARALAEVLAPHMPEVLAVLRDVLAELRGLREDFNKMLIRLESLERRHAEDVSRLREDFNKMLARLEALEKRHAKDTQMLLRRLEALEKRHAEDTQTLLRRIETVERTLNEVLKTLEEHGKTLQQHSRILEQHSRILKEHTKILREHSKILEEHTKILREHTKILRDHTRKLGYLSSLAAEISAVIGASFEEFARRTAEEILRARGILPPDAKLTRKVLPDGTEVNIFCEKPLIVGEVTSIAFSEEDALKLISRVKEVEDALKKKAAARVLMISVVCGEDLARKLRKLAEEHGFILIIGRIIRYIPT